MISYSSCSASVVWHSNPSTNVIVPPIPSTAQLKEELKKELLEELEKEGRLKEERTEFKELTEERMTRKIKLTLEKAKNE